MYPPTMAGSTLRPCSPNSADRGHYRQPSDLPPAWLRYRGCSRIIGRRVGSHPSGQRDPQPRPCRHGHVCRGGVLRIEGHRRIDPARPRPTCSSPDCSGSDGGHRTRRLHGSGGRPRWCHLPGDHPAPSQRSSAECARRLTGPPRLPHGDCAPAHWCPGGNRPGHRRHPSRRLGGYRRGPGRHRQTLAGWHHPRFGVAVGRPLPVHPVRP